MQKLEGFRIHSNTTFDAHTSHTFSETTENLDDDCTFCDSVSSSSTEVTASPNRYTEQYYPSSSPSKSEIEINLDCDLFASIWDHWDAAPDFSIFVHNNDIEDQDFLIKLASLG